MSKIYTKTGDKGETGLVGGCRVSKNDPRINLYGEVDELNSWVGVAISHFSDESKESREIMKYLQEIQHWLFDLGSNLACEKDKREVFKLPTVSHHQTESLETQIDMMDKKLEPLKNFILPGGSQSASFLHICRTKTRSIERLMIEFSNINKREINENWIIFINRLSDYFFIASRFVNKIENISETKWNQ